MLVKSQAGAFMLQGPYHVHVSPAVSKISFSVHMGCSETHWASMQCMRRLRLAQARLVQSIAANMDVTFARIFEPSTSDKADTCAP